ncbi:MAG TPA: acylphosphatase [Gemmatimonadales bacterium]
MANPDRFRWLVSGRVQGVGFRWHVARAAQSLGVTGWVANLPDGRVEVVAQGEPTALAGLELAIKKGPKTAIVESVEKSQLSGDVSIPNTFEIR